MRTICQRLFSWKNLSYWKILWDDCIHEETEEEPKRDKKRGSEENLDLISKMKKGKGKSSSKKGNSDGG
jgi:hypothetical protein